MQRRQLATPARVRGQGDGDLRETNPGDVVPIVIGPRNEHRIWGVHQIRRESHQDALIKRGPVIEQVAGGHETVEGHPRMSGNPTRVCDRERTSVPSERSGTRLRGGILSSETHSSSASRSARKARLGTSGFLGCWQIPGPLIATCARLESSYIRPVFGLARSFRGCL